jgi:hypothetical protein
VVTFYSDLSATFAGDVTLGTSSEMVMSRLDGLLVMGTATKPSAQISSSETMLYIEDTSACVIGMNNTGASGENWRLFTDTSGNFRINNQANGNLVTVGATGDATFAGDVTQSGTGVLYNDGIVHNGDTDTSIKFLANRIYADAGSNRVFDATNSAVTINTAGGTTTFGGNTTFSGGVANLSANGAYFGTAAAANLLDDYEEGTFTPTVTAQTAGSPTYSAQSGRYTKIGNHVTIQGYVAISGGTLPSGNYVTLGGFPFATQTFSPLTVATGSLFYDNITGLASGDTIVMFVNQNGQTGVNLWGQDETGLIEVNGLSATRLTSTSYFGYSMTYFAN